MSKEKKKNLIINRNHWQELREFRKAPFKKRLLELELLEENSML